MNEGGYVYFIKAEGFPRVKIGFTNGPFSVRKDGIQTMSPVELTRLGVLKVSGISARQIEKELHEVFNAYRMWGEWFEFPKEQMSCLKKCFRNREHAFDYNTFKEYWARSYNHSHDRYASRQPNGAEKRLGWKRFEPEFDFWV